MGSREALVAFEMDKLDSGVDHSQEGEVADDTAADPLETNDSSDDYGPRLPKSQDAGRLRKIYEQAHEGRERQRKSNFKALLTSFGLAAYAAVSGFLILRYVTPKSKRPQQVDDGSDYGLHDGYPAQRDNFYLHDNPNPEAIATIDDARQFGRVVHRPSKTYPHTMPADVDAVLDLVYGPLPGDVTTPHRTKWW
ncbi:UNVERIFIED_CONTAM: hypothetical protein HHA_237230 [Hammondia hammondi]|eukprot:XP_008885423.1 hypothetical protein HHA_237230 [Hammondia hammondi]